MFQPIILADIDDMLCHTKGKFRKYVGDEKTLGRPCVFDKQSNPLSFQSAQQRDLLEWLNFGIIVPVTGRSTEKYRAVQLGFSDYAIVSFGGIILTPDGTPEPTWHAQISEQADAEQDNISNVYVGALRAAASISPELSVSVVTDAGIDLLVKIQHTSGDNAMLATMGTAFSQLLPATWTLHSNQGQLAAYPPFLGKKKACEFYLENLAPQGLLKQLIVGCGDSNTDIEFIALCHFMISPVQSQIFRSLTSGGNSNNEHHFSR